jgi:transposase
MLYSVRSERLLMEEIDYSMLYRWFVGLNLDEEVWMLPASRRTGTGSSKPTWRRSS